MDTIPLLCAQTLRKPQLEADGFAPAQREPVLNPGSELDVAANRATAKPQRPGIKLLTDRLLAP